jgi:II/X family phage/plasmid replication protein
VTGCESLIDLVLLTIDKLKKLELVDPTDEQLETIRLGRFRIFKVDIKRDIIFESKQNAIQYLSTLKALSTYPKEKTIFENGIYFGFTSKRWSMCNYYKGQEIRDKPNRSKTSLELKALADLMIRQEIRIRSKQLRTWDLLFGHQWLDLNYIDKFFSNKLEKIYIPKIILKMQKVI